MRLLTSTSFSAPLSAWLESGRHQSLCGRRVFVIDRPADEPRPGQAPLLLLHGFPTSSFDYHLVLPQLARHRRVVALDLPGFGFSDKPEHYSYSLFEQADVVQALIARLGLVRPHVIAHDIGVSIACELLARRHRKLLDTELGSLTLMSAGIYRDLARITPMQKLLQTRLGDFMVGLAIGKAFKLQLQQVLWRAVAETELDAMWEQLLFLEGYKRMPQIAGYLQERHRFEERWLSALRVSDEHPVHLLWGSRDPTAKFAIAERLAEELPGAELTRLSKVGHYPHLEAPDECAYLMEQWLARVEHPAASSLAAQ